MRVENAHLAFFYGIMRIKTYSEKHIFAYNNVINIKFLKLTLVPPFETRSAFWQTNCLHNTHHNCLWRQFYAHIKYCKHYKQL